MRLERAPTREYRTWTHDSRRWRDYRPREGDIVIATYEKSGTTWTQRIVGGLVFGDLEPRPYSRDISIWVDRRFRTNVEEDWKVLAAQTHRRFMKSHLPFDGLPIFDGVKYVHVARDGRDAALSWHNHAHGYTEDTLRLMDAGGEEDESVARPLPRAHAGPADEFHRWLTEGVHPGWPDGLPNTSYFAFERSWWEARHRPNVLMLHYADMLADLRGEIGRLAAFLEIDAAPGFLNALAEASTLRAMQTDGEALLEGAETAFQGGHRRFLNKGENGRWRGIYRAADLALYEEKLAALPAECAHWLASGGRI